MAIITNAVGNYTAFALSRVSGSISETTSMKKTDQTDSVKEMSGYVINPNVQPPAEDYFHAYDDGGSMTGMALGINVNWRG